MDSNTTKTTRSGRGAGTAALAALLALSAAVPAEAGARPRRARHRAAPHGAPRQAAADPTPVSRSAVRVVRLVGKRVEAQGAAAARWGPGLVVWFSERGLTMAEGVVRYRQGARVVIELADGSPAVSVGAQVEPRWQAEARQYGARPAADEPAKGRSPSAGSQGETAGAAARDAAAAARKVWHQPPRQLPWGGKLWLEIVAGPRVRAPVVRWRVGREGPFRSSPMKAAHDGRWTARLAPGQTPRETNVLQYYVGATVAPAGASGGAAAQQEVVVGHPARPIAVAINSRPSRRRRSTVDHVPPSRWSHQKPLPLTARIDRRYRAPVVFYRARGGGSFEVARMKQVSPQVWRATIPSRRVVVPGVSYYLAATDEHGITRPVFRTARRPMNVRVTRGRILATDERRNRVSLAWTGADQGTPGDAWQRVDIGLERLFFGFLVGRVGATATWGQGPRLTASDTDAAPVVSAQPINLYGGHAGLELRAGDYLSASGDLLAAIHNGGAGLGYRFGGRIGDEAGAHLSVSWASIHDLDDGAALLKRLRLGLSTPVGQRLRLAGVVVHEDVLQDTSEALRFQVEATVAVAERLFVTARVGLSGRDADTPGVTGGGGVALTF